MKRTLERQRSIEIIIDRDNCIVCGACSAVCPREALIVEGLALVAIPERCRPCGQAALVCPTGALKCPEPDQNRKSP